MLLNINEMFYYSWPSLTYDAADAACKQIAKDLQNKKILMVVVFIFIFLGTGKCCLQCLLVLCLRLFLHSRRCLIGEAIRGFKLQPK